MSEPKLKSFEISRMAVWEAYRRVKSNKGGAGVDGESMAEFEVDLKANLYKLWNRLSSGSYFPPPVRAVQIPKRDGSSRTLGVPTVADRIAQTVVRGYLEPCVEPVFHEDSFGYRPGRSAHQALRVCRERCWRADWVLDMDIRAFFDSVPWELILKAVAHHSDLRWVLLYVERWLKAPLQREDGSLVWRDRGTPQGSAISPLLVNMFMHYAFGVPRSCVELAGESPAMVMTKQPCSWWAMEGETRLSKPHDKVACKGGEQAYGPYDEESCVSVVIVPAKADQCGSRAPRTRAKAMEGAKTLEVQHRGTRRRIGIGTYAQFSTERGRSVSAPASMASGRQPGVLREVATPITGCPGKWWSAERKSEEVVVAVIGVDNITRRSEGPLARCAIRQRPRPDNGRGASQIAGAGRQRCGERNVSGRLPGGEPCEGELHARFGKG